MKLNNKTLIYLIALAVVVNAVGLFFPVLRSTYGPYYGSIAKHIVISNDWIDLMLSGHDWLDKPHLPFWLTAISYEIFGIKSFAYMLPGFLFNLLGLYFTYKLSRIWYSQKVSWLAVLMTVTAFHLMLSAIDVRAEAFLLGEIMGACYYWVLYDKNSKFIYLLFGAFFTALALMTKGPFVLITIISGVACLWICRGEWYNFIRPKWLLALILSCIFIIPELFALYQQFDLHPEKIIYGHHHVSGIKWFFWGSQFGRFLETGPIHGGDSSVWHYLFFVHTFLWAYLPWWPVFIAAIWEVIKNYKSNLYQSNKNLKVIQDIEATRFLLASFFVTFLLFSISTFQVDHYTNIIFPFASIISANYLVNKFDELGALLKPKIFYIENIIVVLLLISVLVLVPFIFSGIWCFIIILIDLLSCYVILLYRNRDWFFQIIVYPTLAICVTFIFVISVNGVKYKSYDSGYQIAQYLNQKKNIEVASLKVSDINQIDMLSLDLHSENPYHVLDSLNQINKIRKPLYLVVEPNMVSNVLKNVKQSYINREIGGCTIETFLSNIMNHDKSADKLNKYMIIKIND